MKKDFFKETIKQAEKSLKYNDVPVGAIIVKDNKIISKAYNKREKNNLTINHAEIVAISKANKKLKSYFLYNCDMYVTLKPCEMCEKVINNARIRNVYYILNKEESKKDYDKTNITYQQSEYEKYCKEMMSEFFNKLRK